MKSQLNGKIAGLRLAKASVTVICAAVLSACANYAGISSDKQMAQPQSFATQQSIPPDQGPLAGNADWADQFGDTQLKALAGRSIAGQSDTRAGSRPYRRCCGICRNGEVEHACRKVGASYSFTREQYSGTALMPPPYAGSAGNRKTRGC
jgi:hypothetical protein